MSEIAQPDQSGDDVLAELERLRAESLARSAELRSIAEQLPGVVGRRALIRSLVGDVAVNPNKIEIVRRGTAKAVRSTGEAVRRLRPRARG